MRSQATFKLFWINTRLCFLEIATNKGRSFLTCFGIFLGVASLLAMLSFVRGFQEDTNRHLELMGGTRILTISTRKGEGIEEELRFARSPGLRLHQVLRAAEAIPNIERVYPLARGPGRRVRADNKDTWASIRAVNNGHLEEYNYGVQWGRLLEKKDFEDTKHVCVMGQRVISRLWDTPPQTALGRKVTVNHVVFTIVGILKSENMRDRRQWHLIYPYPVYEDQFGGHGAKIPQVDVKVRNVGLIEKTQEDLERFLLAEHRGVMDFDVELNTEKLEDQQKANRVLAILLGTIASISLLVGGVSIANIMFASIGERIREIGIRKSMGARRGDLFIQFFTEALILCSLGGMLGAVLGSVPVFLPQGLFPFIPQLVLFDFLLAGGACMGVGIFSGIFPALYAAKMDPVEALAFS